MGQRISLPLVIGDDGLCQSLREVKLGEWSRRWDLWRTQEHNLGHQGQRRELRVDRETIEKIVEPVFKSEVCVLLMDLLESSYQMGTEEPYTVDAFEFFGTLTAFAEGTLEDKVHIWFEKKNFGTTYQTVHSLQLLLMLSSITKGIYYLSFVHPPPAAYLGKLLPDDKLFTEAEVVSFLHQNGSIYLGNFNNVLHIQDLRRKVEEKLFALNEEMKTSVEDNILEPRQGKFISELSYKEAVAIWERYVSYDPTIISDIQTAAEEECRLGLNISYSKTREDSEAIRDSELDHAYYSHRSVATRDDLVLMLIPAIVCTLVDPYGSDLFGTRHFPHLSDLCSATGLFHLPSLEELVPTVNINHGTFTAETFIREAGVHTLVDERRSYERYLQEEFSKYDADNSGTVERNELEQSIRELIGSQIQIKANEDPVLLDILIQLLCEEVLEEVDEDDSGVVSFEEFKLGIRIIQHKFQSIVSNRHEGLLPVVNFMLVSRLGRNPGETTDHGEVDDVAVQPDDNSSDHDLSEQSDDEYNSGSEKQYLSGSDHDAQSGGLDSCADT